ncbi:MAG: T9SS type A sorting domain-containing protein [Bacteroidia bacterium]|nr:T9SS type A sorting domain-containing protein [Bacteroidia bacterium]
MKTKLLIRTVFLVSWISFSQNTYVPDDHFEHTLINLGYDTTPLDNYVPTASIDTVTILIATNKSISDLTGIEDFISLTELYITSNQITNLDLSKNLQLVKLFCDSNYLTSLDVSSNILLAELRCQKNDLENLNITQNPDLNFLWCYNNDLSSLNVSQNTLLAELDCFDNQITNLDVSNNNNLGSLSCWANNLEELNVKNGNNNNLTYFDARMNPNLSCIEVDDENWSTDNWSQIDPQTSFSEDCRALSSEEICDLPYSMYPNPVNDELILDLNEEGYYTLINHNGQILKSGKTNLKENTIIVSNLSTGLYFVKFNTDKGTITKKLIKL